MGAKSCPQILILPKIFPTRFCSTFILMGKNVCKKSSNIFRWPEMCLLGKILAQDFEMAAVTKILARRDKSIAPLLSTVNRKTLQTQKNAHGITAGTAMQRQPKLLPM